MYTFLLVLIVISETETKFQILLDNQFQSTLSLSRCLLEASKTYFSSVTFILPRQRPEQKLKATSLNNLFLSSLGLDQNVTYYITNLDAHDTEHLMSMRTKNCILQIRDMGEFEDSIHKLKQSAEWNAKSKLTVVSTIPVDNPHLIAGKILKILQENDVLNGVVLLPIADAPSNYSIYAPLTSVKSRCAEILQPVVIDSCFEGTFSSNQAWFLGARVQRTQGCVIRASYMTWPPYVMNVEAGYQQSNHSLNQGLEINLLNLLASLLDFKIVYRHQAKTWGNIFENGTGTEDFALLMNKTVDILISAYTITYIRSLFIENSVSYIRENLMWCVPHVPVWSGIAMGQPEVWVLVVFIYASLTISLWLVSRKNPAEFSPYKCLINTSLASFGVVLGVALDVLPRTRKSRYLMALLIFFGYYTNTLYTSVLTSKVMSPSFEEKYSSMENIYEHNLSTYFVTNSLRYFEGNVINGVPQSLIRSKATDCNNIPECLDSVATGKWAYLCPRMPSSFYIQQKESRRNRIYCFVYSSVGVPVAMMMRKGFPLQESFDTAIHRILNAGFLVKWERDIMRHYDEVEERNVGVTIDNLTDIFKLLVLGYLVSCGVFVIERVVGGDRMKKFRPFRLSERSQI